jgi:putative membrane protein insertion efficiency factor
MKAAIQFVLRGYKRWISPMLPHACRFVPTCSEYALEAVDLHGPLRGSWLAITRLLRCHPFARAGHDPVPRETSSVSHGCDCLASAPAGANSKPLNRH